MRVGIPYIFVVCLFLLTICSAHAQNWLWARNAGGTSNFKPEAVATDAAGNVYVTGSFSSSTITFGTTMLTNAGGADVYLVKYSTSGSVVWAVSAGGTGNDYANSIATDASGNVYITGNFGSASITFGTTTLTNSGGTGSSGANIFLAKFDTSGSALWAKSAGSSTYQEVANGVATDVVGNVYITGFFSDTSINFGGITLTNAANDDIYLVKYSTSGAVLWAKGVGGTADDQAFSVTTDRYGYVYITGFFGSPTLTFGTTTLTDTGGASDVFIAKYDTSGNVHWAKASVGSAHDDIASAVATDAAGNVYIAGGFASATVTFGSATLTNAGTSSIDIFIVKYDSTGGVSWARSAGGINSDWAQSLATDGTGNIYVTGYFASSSITFGATTLTNAGASGSQDMFLVKYNTSGSVVWAQRAGGVGWEYGFSVTVDTSSNVYVAGTFTSPSIAFDTITLTSSGSSNMYVAKYGIPPVTASISAANSMRQDVILFPNPASGKITLDIGNNSYNSATIYDCLGSTIINLPLSGAKNTTQIDVSILPNGIYYLKTISGTASKNIPFIVRH